MNSLKRVIVTLLFEIAKHIDFNYLQILVMNHFDEVKPDCAYKIYKFRASVLDIKKKQREAEMANSPEWAKHHN